MPSESDVAELSLIGERMQAWRQAHPRATLTEIEQELDRHLHAARAAVLLEVAMSEATDLGCCPVCGGALVRRGTHTRTLTTTGDAALTLRRPYTSCLACGAGLFPPG